MGSELFQYMGLRFSADGTTMSLGHNEIVTAEYATPEGPVDPYSSIAAAVSGHIQLLLDAYGETWAERRPGDVVESCRDEFLTGLGVETVDEEWAGAHYFSVNLTAPGVAVDPFCFADDLAVAEASWRQLTLLHLPDRMAYKDCYAADDDNLLEYRRTYKRPAAADEVDLPVSYSEDARLRLSEDFFFYFLTGAGVPQDEAKTLRSLSAHERALWISAWILAGTRGDAKPELTVSGIPLGTASLIDMPEGEEIFAESQFSLLGQDSATQFRQDHFIVRTRGYELQMRTGLNGKTFYTIEYTRRSDERPFPPRYVRFAQAMTEAARARQYAAIAGD